MGIWLWDLSPGLRGFDHTWCPQGRDFDYPKDIWPPSLAAGWKFWPIILLSRGGQFEFFIKENEKQSRRINFSWTSERREDQ